MTEAQEKSIALLTEGNFTTGNVAKMLGVSRATLYNWQKDAEYAHKLQQARAAALKATKGRKVDYKMCALERLHAIIVSDDSSDNATSRAADVMLKHCIGAEVEEPAEEINREWFMSALANVSREDLLEALRMQDDRDQAERGVH